MNNTRSWSISSELIVQEAQKMWFKVSIISVPKNLFSIEWNWKKIFFKNIDGGQNSSYAFKVTKSKDYTYFLLEKDNIRIPKTKYIWRSWIDKAADIIKWMDYPIITKPVDGTHWDWVAVDIDNLRELKDSLEYSFRTWTKKVIIQEQIKWSDHRIVVVWWKMVAAANRIPPFIIWDWKSKVKDLIHNENKNPLRWKWDHNAPLSPIKVDDEAKGTLLEQWYSLTDILEKWKKIFVRKNWNLSTWWISIDVTDKVHPSVKKTCEDAAKCLTLWVAWIDFITTDISKSIEETKWAIIEINHTPWLRMHHFPSEWKSRNVAREILNLTFN